jgi:hypothetical protein
MITIKLNSRLISLDNIDNSCLDATQARVGDASSKDVTNLEKSIEILGLQEPISVEVVNWDDINPQHSTFVLRDGNHRFKAYKNLRNKHKNSSQFNSINCVVYEKNTDSAAASEWLEWQHAKNLHLDKIHKKCTKEDTIFTIYQLLISGYLCSKAHKHINVDNWQHPDVELAIRSWFKTQKGMWTHAERDDIIDKVFSSGGQIYKSKIKRYSRDELKGILKKEFGVANSGKVSEDGSNVRVWTASGDDLWTKAGAPVIKLCQAGKKESHNIIVSHSKSTNTDTIERERNSLKELVDNINDYFSKNVTGFKRIKLIDEVVHLGQKLREGEKVNTLY